MKNRIRYFFLTAAAFLSATMLNAQNTEILYLSGTGLGDTRTWDFYCSGGMKSGKWSKIEVPSQWELQEFGNYTYGRYYLVEGAEPSNETGTYKHKFKVPAHWKNMQVSIVFEGVMTDAEVTVNGKKAGDIHQGGFSRFSYDITDKIDFGKNNQLEVKVWKHSLNTSVNNAERRADWWLFGGIYRPVYITAVPKTHIERIAVDAKHDGSLMTRMFLKNIPEGYSVAFNLTGLMDGRNVGRKIVKIGTENVQDLITKWDGINAWDNENPNLYVLKLELLDGNGNIIHIHEERIGFRTIEFKPKDGIYVNGTKVLMKGINRHTFHPDGGRTTNREISLQDALLIKEMNMNSVRSHYPPDKHFLDICDSLGIFHLDELAGWHGKYDDTTGMKILPEMIARDVNHPSIFMWSNGNEGGWNTKLDPLFAVYDPQQRHVIHPWADFNGLDTHHYPAYQTGTYKLANGWNVFMPTEFLHGLYDRGHGAGLEDYWANWRTNPMFAGGFLWTYIDEAVKRTDKGGILDSDGPNGPDGIVGPYREKEGSFFTVREVWSPIQVSKILVTTSFSGDFYVTNDYFFTNLSECTMRYRVYSFPSPLIGGDDRLIADGMVILPAVDPGETGKAHFDLPRNFFSGDILELEAYDKYGNSVCTWTYPVKFASEYFAEQHQPSTEGAATVVKDNGKIILSANGVEVKFNDNNGYIETVRYKENIIPLDNGPVPVGMKVNFKESYSRTDGKNALYVVKYTGAIDSIVWRMTPDGLLGMDAVMLNRERGGGFDGSFFDNRIYNFGLTFSFPEEKVKGMRWFGRGPYRVWKNRIRGTNYGIWDKKYNNTVTGENFENMEYPEFKGYHANIYWATLKADNAAFTVYSESDGLFLRLFTPEEPVQMRNGENSMHAFPEGDISFLYDIPAMRSFKPISEHGPRSQPSSIRIKPGDDGIRMKLWFDFK